MAVDGFGKEWMTDDKNDLDKLIRKEKLYLTIEYKTNEDNIVYFHLVVKTKKGVDLINFKALTPLNDADILSMIKSVIRNKKIDKILYE